MFVRAMENGTGVTFLCAGDGAGSYLVSNNSKEADFKSAFSSRLSPKN
jgi:hypothetical protein